MSIPPNMIGDDGQLRKASSPIPCFWSALGSGASGSLIAGVVYYMGTSNVKKMHHIVMGSFIIFHLGAWTFCRTQRRNTIEKLMEQKIQDTDSESITS